MNGDLALLLAFASSTAIACTLHVYLALRCGREGAWRVAAAVLAPPLAWAWTWRNGGRGRAATAAGAAAIALVLFVLTRRG